MRRSAAPVPASLADVKPTSYWLDSPLRPEPLAALVGATTADLAVVGGGYTGLWTALLAKEADPSLDVLLLEGREVGWAASGRNGGFVSASLTHGYANGAERFPAEMPRLLALGEENLDAIEATVARYGIACDFRRTGELAVATQPWQVERLQEAAAEQQAAGLKVEFLGRDEVQAEVASPTYLGGLHEAGSCAIVDPARLAWGLKQACLSIGVRFAEGTPVTGLTGESGVMRLTTPCGSVRAAQVALGTNAFPSLVRRARPYVVPVYDYALMTEPLSAAQRAAIGWRREQGIGDSSNLFHYYRLTEDGRILWGGYDAIYHYGSRIAAELDQRPETFAALATHFFATFPQLEGLRFTHAWGGVIDTCSRFSAFWGRAYGGRVAYVAGYTGLGVAATRFGAEVMLDLLSGRPTERTALTMVRTKPMPFPPEPVRWAAIEATRRSVARADAQSGRRNLWLRTLDHLGLGFDS